MRCIQLFVCFPSLFFACWLCMCNCLLVLFFATVLRIVLFTFVAKLFTFALLFLQVFLGATSSFLLSFWLCNLLLFVLQGMFAWYVVLWCSFWIVSCCCWYFCSFRVVVFVYFVWSESIWIYWFWWFLCYYIYFVFYLFAIDTSNCPEPLFFADIPLIWSYLTTSTIPANFLLVFARTWITK